MTASQLLNSLHQMSANTKHVLHCLLMFTIIFVFEWKLIYTKQPELESKFDPFEEYGYTWTSLLYLFRLLACLTLPQALFNFFGLTLYNGFVTTVDSKGSPLLAPFICVRVVTRGDFPDLVKRNVQRNLKTLLDVGLENFTIEVVTDKSIGLVDHTRLREVIVPKDYRTKSGALFKARALQYCLEDEVNKLGESDWIVHLDEETIITENAARGIINFILNGKHEFGQGMITYANEEIVNWVTTLADSYRVADDLGKLRFQFYMFHRPIFSWKGSYVVTRFKAEKDVSFDHGLDGSVAEDCYFSMIAYKKNYTFDFIEGEMWEKSPFHIKDFIQQRKRWLQGIFLVVHSSKIPIKNKIFLGMSLYAWLTMPFSTSNLLWAYMFPLPTDRFVFLNCMVGFVGAVNAYMYMFGVMKSFSLRKIGFFRFVLCLVGSLLAIPFNLVIENTAVFLGVFGKKHKFYVVQKC